MARKTRTTKKVAPQRMDAAKAISFAKNSARKALDAGLEAAATVRQSAVGAFDALVKQGATLEAASRKVAAQRFQQARKIALAQVRKTRKAAVEQANSAKAITVEAVSHLEKVFEQRVSKAISKLGVPTTKDVRALSRQVTQLQASVDGLRRARARAAA